MQNLMYSKTNDLVGAIHRRALLPERQQQRAGWSCCQYDGQWRSDESIQNFQTHAYGLAVRVLHITYADLRGRKTAEKATFRADELTQFLEC